MTNKVGRKYICSPARDWLIRYRTVPYGTKKRVSFSTISSLFLKMAICVVENMIEKENLIVFIY